MAWPSSIGRVGVWLSAQRRRVSAARRVRCSGIRRRTRCACSLASFALHRSGIRRQWGRASPVLLLIPGTGLGQLRILASLTQVGVPAAGALWLPFTTRVARFRAAEVVTISVVLLVAFSS